MDKSSVNKTTGEIEHDMIQIEPYTNVLRKGVFDFTERCFSELGKRFEPIGRHSFYNDIENEFIIFYCLISNGTVVGTVAFKKIDDMTAELKSLYLDKDLRGQGLGSKLMQYAINYANDSGYKTIVLDSSFVKDIITICTLTYL